MGYQTGLIFTILQNALDRALQDEEAFIERLERLVAWYRAQPRQRGELKAHVIQIIREGAAHQKQ